MRRILLVAAAAAFALTAVPTNPASAATTTPPTIRKAYLASTDVFPNPGRGFYRYSETHFTADRTGHRPLDVAALVQGRTVNGITLVFRYFYLDGYRHRDTIDTADLDLIRADLAAARSAGVKLIARFAYTDSSSADAPEARVRAHIAQLGPVLNAHADVIAAIQTGFVGRWGEWYYSDNFASDPSAPWRLSEADWSARRAVLLALLDATVPSIPVQVRYPAIKQRIFPDATDPRSARVGVHNDCFLASADDYGTFQTEADRTWLADQTRSVLMGGESCAVNAPRSQWPTASADLARYHWSYLNADFHTDVLGSWGTDGRAEAARRLGYRLRLVKATLPAAARPGQTVPVRITITNDGYAAPGRRPVQLVVRDATTTHIVPIQVDTRTWAPGATVELVTNLTAPARAGIFKMYLNLPDPSAGLATQKALAAGGGTVNAAYAIRMANVGVWEARYGWNSLRAALTVA